MLTNQRNLLKPRFLGKFLLFYFVIRLLLAHWIVYSLDLLLRLIFAVLNDLSALGGYLLDIDMKLLHYFSANSLKMATLFMWAEINLP